MKLRTNLFIFGISCAFLLAGCSVSSALDYVFHGGQKLVYDVTYGEVGNVLRSHVTISCVRRREGHTGVGKDKSSALDKEGYDLEIRYDSFKCRFEDKELESRYTQLLEKVRSCGFKATIDQQGNILKCDLKDMLDSGDADQDPLNHAVFLPLIAGTWRCILPRLQESVGRKDPLWDRRDWSAIDSEDIAWFMASAETGCRFNVTQRFGKNGEDRSLTTVIWQNVRQVHASKRLGDTKDLTVEASVNIEYNPITKTIDAGSTRITTIRSRSEGPPFRGEAFFQARTITREEQGQ